MGFLYAFVGDGNAEGWTPICREACEEEERWLEEAPGHIAF